MFTFSEMLALVESESNFGAYVCHRRPGGSRATSDLVKQLAIFVTSTMNMVESFFSKARQHPGVPCEYLKFSSQLPASFLEEVVPAGMHTLQV